jgi:hypothetical protein
MNNIAEENENQKMNTETLEKEEVTLEGYGSCGCWI